MKWTIGLVALTLLLAGASVRAENTRDLIEKGDAYYAAFDNVKAFQCYKEAFAQSPDDADLLSKLTWSCNNIGEDLGNDEAEQYFEQAAKYAQKLGELAPKQAKTHFLLAITKGNLALYRGGKEKVRLSRNVEKDAKRAIELDPEYSPPYAALGVYYREVAGLNWALKMFAKHLLGGLPDGTLEDAEKMFLKAIEKDPGNVYAHYQLGLTYEAMEKPRQAAKEYHKVLELPIVDHQDPVFRKESRIRIGKIG